MKNNKHIIYSFQLAAPAWRQWTGPAEWVSQVFIWWSDVPTLDSASVCLFLSACSGLCSEFISLVHLMDCYKKDVFATQNIPIISEQTDLWFVGFWITIHVAIFLQGPSRHPAS